MPRSKAKELSELLAVCKKYGIIKFSYNGFQFDLSGLDQKEKEIRLLKEEMSTLRDTVNKLSLQVSQRTITTLGKAA